MKIQLLILLAAIAALAGCASTKDSVVAATGTVLGVEVAQNPATQLYHAKLGYSRTELAFVPTDKGQTNGGANHTGDVIMELRMHNLFSGGGVYQRLAIGNTAVSQPGASFMFAKGADGSLDPKTAEAVAESLKSIPTVDSQSTALKLPLAGAYEKAVDKAAFDTAAKLKGYSSFADFLSRPSLSVAQVLEMKDALNAAGISIP
jgi:hypothetical protein